ncbi:MAG: DivIVA domain-containing protein, partial [Deltaproteobacteria bacterium]|nr:DivIVA domain-containing protein [Deltaproteobacteria bacterium]
MKLSPIDVQQQQFRSAWRGYDRREVKAFLDLVAEQLTELSRENGKLAGELRQRKRELDEHRDREETLREAMLTAQRAIDEIRDQAKKEAQLVVSEAEMRAEKILHNAHGRVGKIVDEINEVRRQRTRVIEELRGLLSTHSKLLDTYALDAREEKSEGS